MGGIDIPGWCANYSGNMTIYLMHYHCSKIEMDLTSCKPVQTPTDMEDIRVLCEASEIVWYTTFWFSIVVGILGNTLAIITIASLPTSIATFFVGLLSFSDLIAIIMRMVIYFLDKENLLIPNTLYYHIFPLLFDFSVSYSNWLLVLICVDRFITVRYPLLRRVYFTIRHARIAAFTMAVILFAIYLVADQVLGYEDIQMFTVRNLLYSLIPFILICILISLIAIQFRIIHRKRKLLQEGGGGSSQNGSVSNSPYNTTTLSSSASLPIRKQQERGLQPTHSSTSLRGNSRRAQSQNHNQQQQSTKRRPNVFEDIARLENNITIMMMVTAIFFAILTIPNCVLLFTYRFAAEHWNTPVARARWHVFSKTSQALTFLNLSINFLLYFLSAAKFRHQLCQLLRLRRKDNNNLHSKKNAPLRHMTSILNMQTSSETYL